MSAYWDAVIGGAMIGAASSLMLFLNGRITGVSGILSRAIKPSAKDKGWRWSFLGGLFSGGLLLTLLKPEAFANQLHLPLLVYVVAGLLVGFGTVIGSGCTSGHGICGVSRLSVRSIAATCTFILFGILTVAAMRLL